MTGNHKHLKLLELQLISQKKKTFVDLCWCEFKYIFFTSIILGVNHVLSNSDEMHYMTHSFLDFPTMALSQDNVTKDYSVHRAGVGILEKKKCDITVYEPEFL